MLVEKWTASYILKAFFFCTIRRCFFLSVFSFLFFFYVGLDLAYKEMDWCFVWNANAVAALNAILGRWGTNPPKTWNITGGDPCTGTAVDDTNIDDSPVVNPGIKCDCSFNNRTVCHITKLYVHAFDWTSCFDRRPGLRRNASEDRGNSRERPWGPPIFIFIFGLVVARSI